MRGLVGITKNTKMDTVNGDVREIIDGLDVKVRLASSRPNLPWLIEVEANDLDTINEVRQRAIEKWEI